MDLGGGQACHTTQVPTHYIAKQIAAPTLYKPIANYCKAPVLKKPLKPLPAIEIPLYSQNYRKSPVLKKPLKSLKLLPAIKSWGVPPIFHRAVGLFDKNTHHPVEYVELHRTTATNGFNGFNRFQDTQQLPMVSMAAIGSRTHNNYQWLQ